MLDFKMYDPDRRFIYPYSDWGFKELFGTEENKHLTPEQIDAL